MGLQRGRDLIFEVGDGGAPEAFSPVAGAQVVALDIAAGAGDVTPLDAGGIRRLNPALGIQDLELSLQGPVSGGAADTRLLWAALSRVSVSGRLVFPDGGVYAAPFAVRAYARRGDQEGLETFSAVLSRAGEGVLTPGGGP